MSKEAVEALIKYQNILTAMALGSISREEGRKMIDALNKARDQVRFVEREDGNSKSDSR